MSSLALTVATAEDEIALASDNGGMALWKAGFSNGGTISILGVLIAVVVIWLLAQYNKPEKTPPPSASDEFQREEKIAEKLKPLTAWQQFEHEMGGTGLSNADMSAMYAKAKDIVNGKGEIKNPWGGFQALLKEYNVYNACAPVNEKWDKMKEILKVEDLSAGHHATEATAAKAKGSEEAATAKAATEAQEPQTPQKPKKGDKVVATPEKIAEKAKPLTAWQQFEHEMGEKGLSKADMSAMYAKAQDVVNGKGPTKNPWNDFQALLKEYNVSKACAPVNEKWAKMKQILKATEQ